MANGTEQDVLASWETSSQYWNKHQALIEQMFAPMSRALIDAACIVAGQRVLDVGGGSGEPSLTIAPIVGESGSVAYTDPAAGMVEAARSEAHRRGLRNITFNQCPAEQLPFSDSVFDAAVSRLSVMFLPDVPAGIREILRVLRPGGYVSFVVWAAREVNPFFRIITEVLDKFVTPEEEPEDALTAFRFAQPGKLASALQKAGVAASEHELSFRIEAPIGVERFWELRTEMSDSFRNKLKKLSAGEVATIKSIVTEAVAPYFEAGQMSFPAQVRVVTGRKG